MYKELYGLTEWVDEKDFEKRKTNTYAIINDIYFMKVKRKIPEELYSMEGIFNFYFCRVRKIADKQFKIEGRGKTYKVVEDIMLASQYLSISDESNMVTRLVAETYNEHGDYPVATNSFIDNDGNIHRFVSPIYDDEYLVSKPKKLSIEN